MLDLLSQSLGPETNPAPSINEVANATLNPARASLWVDGEMQICQNQVFFSDRSFLTYSNH